MKRKFILAFAVVALFALSFAAFAYSKTNAVPGIAARCCCSGDSCPMKKKDGTAQNAEGKSCDCSCCKHEKEKKDTTAV